MKNITGSPLATRSAVPALCAVQLSHLGFIEPLSARVIAKAEGLPKGDNPRLVVTDLPKTLKESIQHVYETLYCIRGDMDYVA